MNDGVSYTDVSEKDGYYEISKFLIKNGTKVADLVSAKDVKYQAKSIEISDYQFRHDERKLCSRKL
ncbi:MAG: hypothetical protein IPG08_09320 [Sphingobacteriaceae bacterium]|nr:hypothetical protein [Sphingobacteriaceae bacterium]